MKRVTALSTIFTFIFVSTTFAVTLTDLLKNDFVAFSAVKKDDGGYVIFLQKLSSIYACAIEGRTSSCVLVDGDNQTK
jgi:hypothetical protein